VARGRRAGEWRIWVWDGTVDPPVEVIARPRRARRRVGVRGGSGVVVPWWWCGAGGGGGL
jgi:hypothetical protein